MLSCFPQPPLLSLSDLILFANSKRGTNPARREIDMKPSEIPQLLVTIDYQELFAYLVHPDGIAERIEHVDFQSDGPTSAPLLDWCSSPECHQSLAHIVDNLLDRYRPSDWGLACSQGLSQGLEAHLSPEHRDLLLKHRCMDTSGLTVSNVTTAFGGGGDPPCAEIP